MKKDLTALMQEYSADIDEAMALAVITNLGIQLTEGEGGACYHHMPGPNDAIDPTPCVFFSCNVEAGAWGHFQGTTAVKCSCNGEVLW